MEEKKEAVSNGGEKPIEKESSIIHEIPEEKNNTKQILIGVVAFLIIVGLGAGSGYLAAIRGVGVAEKTGETPKIVKEGKVVGSTDVKTFRDNTEGILQKNESKNGAYQEGSHVLLRGKDVSQTVNLTSSVVDLDLYVGRKVRVWGETNKGLKSGWLMDVGRVEVLE